MNQCTPTTRAARPKLARLTDEQSALVATLYPRALALAEHRASRIVRSLDDRFIDAATDELIRASRAYAGLNRATFGTYAGRRINLGMNLADRRKYHPVQAWPSIESEEFAVLPSSRVDDDDAFEAMIRPLGARNREVLTMRYRLDMTDREIGERFGIKQPGVNTMISRAIGELRERMGVEVGGKARRGVA